MPGWVGQFGHLGTGPQWHPRLDYMSGAMSVKWA